MAADPAVPELGHLSRTLLAKPFCIALTDGMTRRFLPCQFVVFVCHNPIVVHIGYLRGLMPNLPHQLQVLADEPGAVTRISAPACGSSR